MSIITSKKIIATLIVAIMMITMTTPIFAAVTVSTSKWGSAKTSFDVKVGETIKIYVKSNDYNGNMFWTSSNNSVARIMGGTNSWCEIKGITAGKSATIKIREGSSSGKVAGSFTINVKKSESNASYEKPVFSSNKFSFLTTLLKITIKGIDITAQITGMLLAKMFEIKLEEPKQEEPKQEEGKEEEKEPVESVTSGTNVYLTSYKATDDNNGNFGTAYAGVLLKRDEKGKIGIVHRDVYVNSNRMVCI